jgi:DNA-binding MarR family transcriptional regulator
MKRRITTSQYRALAELRYRIRHFLQQGDASTWCSNLEPQQYLMLFTIRGLPQAPELTIRTLAERLALKHHSTVGLIDRLEMQGLVHRSRSKIDRREVRVSLSTRGATLLRQVARQRLGELRSSGAALAGAINSLVQRTGNRRAQRGRKQSA